jgi:cellulose synthase/poly-beta-1,6-N-acetylglucosamine synthase-like glycosyltransferase
MVQGVYAGNASVQKKSQPFITVIIPVLNAQSTIGKCIKALMGQDYPGELLEIIAVDNGSMDQTRKVIKTFPVNLFVEPKAGSYNARNLALSHATGEIIAFSDSDCIPAPDWLSQLVQGFSSSKIAGCGGKIEDFVGTGWVQKYSNQHVLRQESALSAETRPHPYIIGANMAYRREIFEKLGPFDGRFISGGDTDMSWRVQQAGYQLAYVPGAVVHHFHRATVSGLYGQYFRYGIGRHCLTCKHLKETGDRHYSYPIHRSFRRSHDVFRSWLNCVWATSLFSENAKSHFLTFIRQGAHLSGLLA